MKGQAALHRRMARLHGLALARFHRLDTPDFKDDEAMRKYIRVLRKLDKTSQLLKS